ncbi:MAG TPA: OmpA family protein [Bacteroidia bacterium]|jgi:chemotaxis protein MotB|nr:OmpA family protein [Bacteroidia bacterium]
MKINIIAAGLASIIIGFYSCVPANKLTEEQNKRKACQAKLDSIKALDDACETNKTELKAKIDLLQNELSNLQHDTSFCGANYRETTAKYNKLNDVNEELLTKYNDLMKGNESSSKKISGQLQLTQAELLEKEDQLNTLQDRLNKEKLHLDSLNTKLQQREARVSELEGILSRKDAAVDSLKKRISNALLGFADKGISVYEKNGKVYVSMEEALLFPSGSTKVQPEGIDALNKLAQALESNSDINVMVEGHTDDVTMNGKGDIKDNWDLSVMRATSIIKILLQDAKIDPSHLMASGVSEYDPVDPAKTKEARQKNRRTDIILTPKLTELFKILNAQ